MKTILFLAMLLVPVCSHAQTSSTFNFTYNFDKLSILGATPQPIQGNFTGNATFEITFSNIVTGTYSSQANSGQYWNSTGTKNATSTIDPIWKPAEMGSIKESSVVVSDLMDSATHSYANTSMVSFISNYFKPASDNTWNAASLSIEGLLQGPIADKFSYDFVVATTNSIGSNFTARGGLVPVTLVGSQLIQQTAYYEYSGTAFLNKAIANFTSSGSGGKDDPYLPTSVDITTSPGAPLVEYGFSVESTPGTMTYIDPVVAVGYDYKTDDGALIQAINLPNIGDGLYNIYTFDSSGDLFQVAKDWSWTQDFNFSGTGVNKFRVDGIETGAGLDPGDFNAFNTGLLYSIEGTHRVTMTALTVDTDNPPSATPEPGTMLLMSLGAAGVAFMKRRRGAMNSNPGRAL
ncbi:hypothetical protein NNJEOMEG_00692 [Fundidesulfovibrio magnetotacticus]|uniref:Ice-binding protein C-terminal domain-containing protein n=1 Tax=Fundidesulfovibrio magnetotacticus TaxID=2730080 RepID=A0A6V8LMD7_9BACT|nr:PEP-CTERM sorting domain-containing protein [Fundidesulfovibrio magnetotacticus]GFK92864.1 hypothetical protein NNJEOMEG_00692 [Fundidesulfovibrio magnetotacticus]